MDAYNVDFITGGDSCAPHIPPGDHHEKSVFLRDGIRFSDLHLSAIEQTSSATHYFRQAVISSAQRSFERNGTTPPVSRNEAFCRCRRRSPCTLFRRRGPGHRARHEAGVGRGLCGHLERFYLVILPIRTPLGTATRPDPVRGDNRTHAPDARPSTYYWKIVRKTMAQVTAEDRSGASRPLAIRPRANYAFRAATASPVQRT